ncbi:MAG: D-mannonate epimerase, partial [Kiritimatiellia bacterium]|nr:D-mannonate epimerase [Kiritimatiellia bacterium]
MLYFSKGSPDLELSPAQRREAVFQALKLLGPRKKVLALPPDFTRFHSHAGELTRYVYEYYGDAL